MREEYIWEGRKARLNEKIWESGRWEGKETLSRRHGGRGRKEEASHRMMYDAV